MKKKIAKKIKELAQEMPLQWKVEPVTILMEGWELNLSGYGEVRKFEKNKVYEVPFFQLRAVEHKQQIKDALKKDGLSGVSTYIETLNLNNIL